MTSKSVLRREAIQRGDSVDNDNSDKTGELKIEDRTGSDSKRTDGSGQKNHKTGKADKKTTEETGQE